LQAITASGDKQSEISRKEFDIAPTKWKVIHPDENSLQIIDGNSDTWWNDSENEDNNEIAIDLGEILDLKGFTYLPMQGRFITGFIKEYEFYVSEDNKNWTLASKGEFGNILNSPILQRITFDEQSAKYIKLKAVKTVNGNIPSFAEVGILTK